MKRVSKNIRLDNGWFILVSVLILCGLLLPGCAPKTSSSAQPVAAKKEQTPQKQVDVKPEQEPGCQKCWIDNPGCEGDDDYFYFVGVGKIKDRKNVRQRSKSRQVAKIVANREFAAYLSTEVKSETNEKTICEGKGEMECSSAIEQKIRAVSNALIFKSPLKEVDEAFCGDYFYYRTKIKKSTAENYLKKYL